VVHRDKGIVVLVDARFPIINIVGVVGRNVVQATVNLVRALRQIILH
jgi:hypothetical protein